MSASNSIHLIGRITRDPEQRTVKTKNGDMAVVNFSLAVDNKSRADAETDFFSCSVIGKQAETLCKYVTKGTQLAVTGELHYRKWTGRDGEEKKDVQVSVSSFQMLGSKTASDSQPGTEANSNSSSKPKPATQPVSVSVPEEDDDLPF